MKALTTIPDFPLLHHSQWANITDFRLYESHRVINLAESTGAIGNGRPYRLCTEETLHNSVTTELLRFIDIMRDYEAREGLPPEREVRYTLEAITVEGRLAVLQDDPYGLYYRLTEGSPAR